LNPEDTFHAPEAETPKEEWYYRPWVIVVAIFCFGPLGLIPLWFRPRTNIYLKVFVSVIVIASTVWVTIGTVEIYKDLMERVREISAILDTSGQQ